MFNLRPWASQDLLIISDSTVQFAVQLAFKLIMPQARGARHRKNKGGKEGAAKLRRKKLPDTSDTDKYSSSNAPYVKPPSKAYSYDALDSGTNSSKDGKDGRFWRPKSEGQKDKEFEDYCEKWLAKLVGMGIFAFTMFGFFSNLGDYVMRSNMDGIDTNVDLDGRVAVVTGGNDGIGREVAINLAMAGAKVYIGARNVSNTESSINKELQGRLNQLSASGSPSMSLGDGLEDMEFEYPDGVYPITSYELKLHNFKSVTKFASAVLEDIEDPVSLLVNNGGTRGGKFACSPTIDGYNWNVQVNHLSHFLLTQLFLPSLKKSHGGARVVHVTCADAWNGKALVRDGIRNKNKNLLNSDGPNLEHCHPEETYARSKLLQIAFSNEFQRRMKVGSFVSRSQVTSNVINPGSTATLYGTKDGASEVRSRRLGFGPWRYIFMFFQSIFSYLPLSGPSFTLQRSVSHSGKAVFHVATSFHLNKIGGRYFSDRNGPFTSCGIDNSRSDAEEEEGDVDDASVPVCGEGPHPPLALDSQAGGKVWSQSMKAVRSWLK